jgi:hypothetical protein
LAFVAGPASAQSDPRLLAAVRLSQDGLSDSARAVAGRLLAATQPADSLYPEALYTMGLLAATEQDRRLYLRRVAVDYTQSVWADDALLLLAQLDYSSGNAAAAVRQIDQLLRDYPGSPLTAQAAFWGARAAGDRREPILACRMANLGLAAVGDDIELRNQLEFQRQRCQGLSAMAADSVRSAAADSIARAVADSVARAKADSTARAPTDHPPGGPGVWVLRPGVRGEDSGRGQRRRGANQGRGADAGDHPGGRLAQGQSRVLLLAGGGRRRRDGPGAETWRTPVRGQSAVSVTLSENTPLLIQYREIKSRHRDSILFFRMGDFYEMFFEDAEVASRVLDITLTSRGDGVPLAGVPVKAAAEYLRQFVSQGYRVAICEQVEDPRKPKASCAARWSRRSAPVPCSRRAGSLGEETTGSWR